MSYLFTRLLVFCLFIGPVAMYASTPMQDDMSNIELDYDTARYILKDQALDDEIQDIAYFSLSKSDLLEDQKICHEYASRSKEKVNRGLPSLKLYETHLNLDKFREISPKPLPEIQGVKSLAKGFEELLSQICLKFPSHPMYLHISAIDEKRLKTRPSMSRYKIRNLKHKFICFLKKLEGIDLGKSEKEYSSQVWDVPPLEKAEVINNLKHIYVALDQASKKDKDTFLTGMAMILNGLTQCQSGIHESINSVMNFMVRKEDFASGTFEEIVARLVNRIVEEKFLQVFAPGSPTEEEEEFDSGDQNDSAHVLSAYREVFHDVIGVPQSSLAFREKIKQLTLEEKDEAINQFFDVFNHDILAEELLSYIQSEKDLRVEAQWFNKSTQHKLSKNNQKRKRSENDALPKKLKQLKVKREKNKKARPITINQINQWLMAHSKLRDKGKRDFSFLTQYGLSLEGNKSISKDGLSQILYEMAYLKTPALT